MYNRLISLLAVIVLLGAIGMTWAMAPAPSLRALAHFRANTVPESDNVVCAVWHRDTPEYPVYMSCQTVLRVVYLAQ